MFWSDTSSQLTLTTLRGGIGLVPADEGDTLRLPLPLEALFPYTIF
jgi:hypothetical protein